ncbi:MAG: PAS domain S-box protein [Rhodospirillaceae bacterium]|nr:PAS domain S-box protein [Rhodospirillaceae bacterium]
MIGSDNKTMKFWDKIQAFHRRGKGLGRLKRLAALVAALLFGTIIYAGVTEFQVIRDSIKVNDEWVGYARHSIAIDSRLTRLKSEFGYGGFIHNFKNYILRQDPELTIQAERKFATVKESIKDLRRHFESIYRNGDFHRFSPDAVTRIIIALDTLEAGIDEYWRKLELAQKLVAGGDNAEEIDAQIIIDDQPTLAALQSIDFEVATTQNVELSHINRGLERILKSVSRGSFILPLLFLTGFITIWLLWNMVNQIVSRREAEAALVEREAFFRLLATVAPVGIFHTDREGACVYINERWKSLTGLSQKQALSDGWADALYPDDRNWVYAKWKKTVGEGSPFRQEFRFLHQDGRTLWVLVQALPETDREGRVRGYIGTITDITELRETEADLQRSEELFAKVFHGSPGLFAITRMKDGLHYDVNDVWLATLGYKKEDVIGKTSQEIDVWVDRADRKRLVGILEKDGRARNFESRLKTKNGQVIDVLIDCEKVEIDGEERNLIVAHDVTEIQRLKGQLQNAQKMEAARGLTSGIAHQFNNLFMGVSGSLELLSENQSLDDNQQKMIDLSLMEIQRGKKLTTQLLAYTSQQPLTPRRINLRDTIREQIYLFDVFLGETLEFKSKINKDLWDVEVDPGEMDTALFNIFSNARDSMPTGGKVILEATNVSLDKAEAGQKSLKAGDYITLSIRDEGVGMSPEVISRAFDPFFTTKDVGQGAGLGLSMVSGFATQSRGGAEIESTSGEGSVVRIYLPRAAGAAEEKKKTARKAGKTARGSETVLVVEMTQQCA